MDIWFYKKYVVTGGYALALWHGNDVTYVSQHVTDDWDMASLRSDPAGVASWEDNAAGSYDMDTLQDSAVCENGGYSESWFPGFPSGYPAGKYWKVYFYNRYVGRCENR